MGQDPLNLLLQLDTMGNAGSSLYGYLAFRLDTKGGQVHYRGRGAMMIPVYPQRVQAFMDLVVMVLGSMIFIILWFSFMLGVSGLYDSLSVTYPTEMAEPGVQALMGSWWVLPSLFLIGMIFTSMVLNNKRRKKSWF